MIGIYIQEIEGTKVFNKVNKGRDVFATGFDPPPLTARVGLAKHGGL